MKLFFYVIFAALALTTPLAPALGEDYARESVEEIVRNTEESFRSASSAREKAYVASVCKSRMARQSFPVRDKLRAEAESLISANAVDDAKLFFRLIDRVADLDRRRGNIVCAPWPRTRAAPR